ncbi:unnamed protein product [Closterium sp. NIES-64]|nr:unnamed protein product [Closterium sp. NIES-64]
MMFTVGTSWFSVGSTVTAEITDFVNFRDPSGKSALHEACAHGHAEIARLLLSLGALPAARKANGFTPLLCAAAGGHAECARLLLAHMRVGESAGKLGADSSENAAGGSAGGGRASAWRAADRCGENALHLAARAGVEEVVAMLVDAAEREDKHMDLSGEAPRGEGENKDEGVGCAGASASPTSSSTASVSSLTCPARSPLVNSERQSQLFVNSRTRNGRTPLHSSCLHGHVAVCELLLKHGADPTARDSSGSEPIHEAAAGGHVAVINLLAGGATAPAGHVDAMRALSQHGADLDPSDNSGTTPLYWAASRGHVAAVEWLLEKQEQEHQKGVQEGTAARGGGDDNRCSKDRGRSKRSALHVAVGWGHVGVCSLLLASRRFDPLQPDLNGLTAFDLATQLLDEGKRVQILNMMSSESLGA